MSRGRRAATLWRNRRLLCPLRNTPRHSSLQTPLDLPRTPKPLNFFFPSHALLLACSRVNFSPICLRACLLIWFLCLHALRYFQEEQVSYLHQSHYLSSPTILEFLYISSPNIFSFFTLLFFPSYLLPFFTLPQAT